MLAEKIKDLYSGLFERVTGLYQKKEEPVNLLRPPDLTPYKDQWVVMSGLEVIAHEKELHDALEAAKKKGVEEPYVFYVSPVYFDKNATHVGL